jgi:hypothetical protein
MLLKEVMCNFADCEVAKKRKLKSRYETKKINEAVKGRAARVARFFLA